MKLDKKRSLDNIFYPCSQMKDYESIPLLNIQKAEGSYIYLQSGEKIIDGISSWWCKSLGHRHPRLIKALQDQLEKFEHVIMANTTHENLIELSQKLGSLMPGLNKVFYASDGSCAVEIAMKMSLHSRIILGEERKSKFMALSNGYHGETLGSLSVSDSGKFKTPYEKVLFETRFIKSIPYVSGIEDPLWSNCGEIWDLAQAEIEPYLDQLTAILFEPIVQGSAGMKIISQDFLSKLACYARENNIHLIADEIMTGLGRTGKILACEYGSISPDFICLAKGLTAGVLPLSAVIIKQSISEYFYDDYEKNKSFLHSHTHSGNALAISVALETLKIIQEENICEKAFNLQNLMREKFQEISEQTSGQENTLKNIRGIGGIIAADLNYLKIKDPARTRLNIFKYGVENGVLLRSLGETIYWLPPLNISREILNKLAEGTLRVIQKL